MSTLRKQQQQHSAPKRLNFRPALRSPYTVTWPSVDTNESDAVLSTIKKFIKDHKATSKEVESGSKGDVNVNKASTEKEEDDVVRLSTPYLEVGINAVTRALEQHKLRAVVLAVPNSQARQLCEHIMILACIHSVPVLPIHCYPANLGRPFGYRSATTLGITAVGAEDPMTKPLYDALLSFPIAQVPVIPYLVPLQQAITEGKVTVKEKGKDNTTKQTTEKGTENAEMETKEGQGSSTIESKPSGDEGSAYAPLHVTKGHRFPSVASAKKAVESKMNASKGQEKPSTNLPLGAKRKSSEIATSESKTKGDDGSNEKEEGEERAVLEPVTKKLKEGT